MFDARKFMILQPFWARWTWYVWYLKRFTPRSWNLKTIVTIILCHNPGFVNLQYCPIFTRSAGVVPNSIYHTVPRSLGRPTPLLLCGWMTRDTQSWKHYHTTWISITKLDFSHLTKRQNMAISRTVPSRFRRCYTCWKARTLNFQTRIRTSRMAMPHFFSACF